MNKSEYNFSLDVIRVLAILGVVIIHTTNAVYSRPDFFGGTTWWVTIILDSISRISIPLFILISGYLILRKEESFKDSLRRIFFRIFIPLIAWTIFYTWYSYGSPSLSYINWSIIWQLYSGGGFHLYFLVVVVGLYFVAPILRSYLSKISRIDQKFFLKVILIVCVIDMGLRYYFRICDPTFFTRWIPYTGFFVAGYILMDLNQKLSKVKLLIGYTIGLLATISLNYLNSYLIFHKNFVLSPGGCLSSYPDHYVSINVVAMSIFAFLLLTSFGYEKIKSNILSSKIIQSVAKAAFGIYLIHPFVNRFLEVQFHLAVDFSTLPIAVIVFLKIVLVFIISYIIAAIGRKIPVVKLAFGER